MLASESTSRGAEGASERTSAARWGQRLFTTTIFTLVLALTGSIWVAKDFQQTEQAELTNRVLDLPEGPLFERVSLVSLLIQPEPPAPVVKMNKVVSRKRGTSKRYVKMAHTKRVRALPDRFSAKDKRFLEMKKLARLIDQEFEKKLPQLWAELPLHVITAEPISLPILVAKRIQPAPVVQKRVLSARPVPEKPLPLQLQSVLEESLALSVPEPTETFLPLPGARSLQVPVVVAETQAVVAALTPLPVMEETPTLRPQIATVELKEHKELKPLPLKLQPELQALVAQRQRMGTQPTEISTPPTSQAMDTHLNTQTRGINLNPPANLPLLQKTIPEATSHLDNQIVPLPLPKITDARESTPSLAVFPALTESEESDTMTEVEASDELSEEPTVEDTEEAESVTQSALPAEVVAGPELAPLGPSRLVSGPVGVMGVASPAPASLGFLTPQPPSAKGTPVASPAASTFVKAPGQTSNPSEDRSAESRGNGTAYGMTSPHYGLRTPPINEVNLRALKGDIEVLSIERTNVQILVQQIDFSAKILPSGKQINKPNLLGPIDGAEVKLLGYDTESVTDNQGYAVLRDVSTLGDKFFHVNATGFWPTVLGASAMQETVGMYSRLTVSTLAGAVGLLEELDESLGIVVGHFNDEEGNGVANLSVELRGTGAIGPFYLVGGPAFPAYDKKGLEEIKAGTRDAIKTSDRGLYVFFNVEPGLVILKNLENRFASVSQEILPGHVHVFSHQKQRDVSKTSELAVLSALHPSGWQTTRENKPVELVVIDQGKKAQGIVSEPLTYLVNDTKDQTLQVATDGWFPLLIHLASPADRLTRVPLLTRDLVRGWLSEVDEKHEAGKASLLVTFDSDWNRVGVDQINIESFNEASRSVPKVFYFNSAGELSLDRQLSRESRSALGLHLPAGESVLSASDRSGKVIYTQKVRLGTNQMTWAHVPNSF